MANKFKNAKTKKKTTKNSKNTNKKTTVKTVKKNNSKVNTEKKVNNKKASNINKVETVKTIKTQNSKGKKSDNKKASSVTKADNVEAIKTKNSKEKKLDKKSKKSRTKVELDDIITKIEEIPTEDLKDGKELENETSEVQVKGKKKKIINSKTKIKEKKSKNKTRNISKEKVEDEKNIDNINISELNDSNKKNKKFKLKNKKFVKYALISLLSCVLVFSVTTLVLYELDMFKNRVDSKNLANKVIRWPNFDDLENNDDNEINETPSENEERIPNPEEVSVDFGRLRSINSDTVGWMMFNKMQINNPVVHSYDNDYYLHHNFYKNNSEVGTIFMDYRNKSFDDRNVVLFGHSNLDGTMFGSLYDIFKSGFFSRENADIIYFYDTNNNLLKYQIFSYYTIESEEYYITTNFRSDEAFQSFIDTIKARSFGYRNVSVGTGDKILTLSTCAGSRGTNLRRVVHAKRI